MEIKICPFCGSENVEVGSVDDRHKVFWVVGCNDCHAFGPVGEKDAIEAIELWNNWNEKPTTGVADQIKSCPFCESRKIEAFEQFDFERWFTCECADCGVFGPMAFTEKEARELWNKRIV